MRKRNGHRDYPAPTDSIWILIDVCNGNPRSRNYLWWFETRKIAEEFKRHHNESPNPLKSTLFGPFHYKAVDIGEAQKQWDREMKKRHQRTSVRR
jgi:hypothetical protein